VFDLLRNSRLLREHVSGNRVAFGINVEIRDFQHDKKKDLDLVICQPASAVGADARTLTDLVSHYQIELTKKERAELAELPELREANVGSVLIALEAKACMTAHQRALPRLHAELDSSHVTVHGAHDGLRHDQYREVIPQSGPQQEESQVGPDLEHTRSAKIGRNHDRQGKTVASAIKDGDSGL
jgi:hypothetical protein